MMYDKMVVAESSLDGAGTSYIIAAPSGGSPPPGGPQIRGERMDKPTIVVHAYPVYVDDWRGSETRMETNLEQRMLLWELIFYCFKEGSLPTDEAKLRKIADCSEAEWKRCWPRVRHKFEERSGRLHHPRVDAEMARITENREKAVASGKTGARKRWGAYSPPKATPKKMDREPLQPPQCDLMATNPYPMPDPNQCRVDAAKKPPAPATPPLTLDEWNEPDPTVEGRLLVERLAKVHPEPGAPDRAAYAAARALAGAVNMPAVIADIEANHEAWCAYWAANPKKFRTMLHTWFESGDYRQRPKTDGAKGAKEAGW